MIQKTECNGHSEPHKILKNRGGDSFWCRCSAVFSSGCAAIDQVSVTLLKEKKTILPKNIPSFDVLVIYMDLG